MNTEGFILTPPSYVREREPFSRFPSFPSLMKEHGIGWGGCHKMQRKKPLFMLLNGFLRALNHKLNQIEDKMNF